MITDKPAIALIICTYNREKFLPQALDSIKKLIFDTRLFELIIIDNNSTDNTANIAQNFIRENLGIIASYFFEANKGLSFARNRGVKEAKAPILAYVDDDVILSPEYLGAIKDFFNKHPSAMGAGGKVTPKYESGSEPPWMSKYLAGFVGNVNYGTEIRQFDNTMKYPAGCNMIYKKEIILKAGGFNNELTFRSDDKYIFFKIKQLSSEIYYLPGASLQHYIDTYRLTFENFRKLFLKTGNEEKIRVAQEKGKPAIARKFVEYTVKFAASIGLYMLFLLKGQEVKGRYVVFAQWYTLKGFLRKTVFVR